MITVRTTDGKVLNLEDNPVAIQKCGDRDKKGTISIHDYANCIPANAMSDRGQTILLVDDLYKVREPYVYTNYCPTLRAQRFGLKIVKY